MNETSDKNFDSIIKGAQPEITLVNILSLFSFSFPEKFLLLVFVSVCCLPLIADFPEIPAKENILITVNKDLNQEGKKTVILPSSEEIMTRVSSRELFAAAKAPPPPPKIIKTGPSLSEKLKAYTLVGILNEEPYQAIIEAVSTKETYYVKAGDMLFDMQVTNVSDGSVTITYNDETMVLR